MPEYCYFCDANQTLVIVHHDMDTRLKTWGEVCYLNQMEPGETDPATPVRKIITAPNIIINSSNSELKNLGFTKLVKRDEG
ncbi:MAG: zinc ribbon domain-containing protein, partial [Gammaproteobacteria bacterium]|nr:zinc ribbon domain-containing protein [Gammaproteobacteria bacterium]